MRLETLKLSELNPAEYNPRTITKEEFEGLKKSLETFGQQENLIVNKDMTVISGHQRLEAMKALGWTEAVCNMVDLDKHQEKKLNVIMNSTAISGKYDDLKLSEILEELKLDDDYESLRLDVLEPLDLSDVEIEEDEAPEVSGEPPKSKLGEVYQLGRHRVMCGDSTNNELLQKLLDGNTPELLFTDPPYKFETQGGGVLKNSRQMNEVKANGVNEFDTTTLIAQCKTNIYFHNKSLIKEYAQLAEDWGMAYDLAIYKKPGLPNWSGHLMTDIEYIAIIGELDPNKGMDMPMYSKVYEGKKDQDNELSYSKPIELCVKFIKLYSREAVLDTFLGSGSTLIACEQTDRTCYGCELDEKYVDVIRKRYWKFINDGNEEGWEDGTTN